MAKNDNLVRYTSVAHTGLRGRQMRVEQDEICVNSIRVDPRHRQLSDEAVEKLMESISKIGLQTPITVNYFEYDEDDTEHGNLANEVVLVAGLHRLEACRRLGHEKISCNVLIDYSVEEAEKWEIAENLHRAELTDLERSEHIARWIELTEKENYISFQHETKPLEKPLEGGRTEGGISKAARELGVEKTQAHRAIAKASLSHEAKVYAIENGLDNNQSALLEASKGETAEEQVAILTSRKSKARKAKRTKEQIVEDKANELGVLLSELEHDMFDEIIELLNSYRK